MAEWPAVKPQLRYLPDTLDDGERKYELVSQERHTSDEPPYTVQVALYQTIPHDGAYYTPALSWLENRASDVRMVRLSGE